MEVEQATYPKFRESVALKPHPNTAEPNFCSLFVDEQAWNHRANGTMKGVKLYNKDRFPDGKHPLFPPAQGAPYFYDTDQGPKQSFATKLLDTQFSRNRTSWGIEPRFRRPATTCDEKVGPGTYSPSRFPASPPRSSPTATAPFLDRPVTEFGSTWDGADPDTAPYSHTHSVTTSQGYGFSSTSPSTPQRRAKAYKGKPSTAPMRSGTASSGSRRRAKTAMASPITRPHTRGELQSALMQFSRRKAMMQTRRLVKKRVDRESDPFIDKAESNTKLWTRRSNFGNKSIDPKGFSISTSPRFADLLLARKRSSQLPAPGQYYKPSSMIRKPVHKHDPRNDFPAPKRRRRRRRAPRRQDGPAM